MKTLYILLFQLLFVANAAIAQVPDNWLTDFEEAKAEAKASNKTILMVFAGSDWCRPCIVLKRNVLLSEEFTTYSDKNVVLLYLDFPSKKKNKLPEQQTAHNEKLAEQYNPQGVFPKVILFSAEGEKIKDIDAKRQTPESFVAQLK